MRLLSNLYHNFGNLLILKHLVTQWGEYETGFYYEIIDYPPALFDVKNACIQCQFSPI